MLGTDKSRGYCLEMISADFLAIANLDSGQPNVLLYSISRFFKFLPGEQRRAFVEQILRKRHEPDSGKEFSATPRSQIVRKPAAAGVTPGRIEVPELRRDVESRGSPWGIA
jgi:hypothetical protein